MCAIALSLLFAPPKMEFGKSNVGLSNSCVAGVLETEDLPGTEASSVPVWARRPGVA